MGFLQVYWDPNRQAIHDRICFTAVIRDPDGSTLHRLAVAHGTEPSGNDN